MRNTMDALRPLAAIVALLAVGVFPPYSATIVSGGQTDDLPIAAAIVGTVQVVYGARLDDPQDVYPKRAQEEMPEGAAWWLAALAPLGAVALVGGALLMPLDVLTARTRIARRWWDPRGSRRREWARPRDVRPLIIGRRQRGGQRFTFGVLDGRLLAGGPESHPLICAPPRAGKTTGLIIPWLLEHDGPAVVTSTKTDVYEVTAEPRSRGGGVWLFDPFAEGSCCWDPLEGCEDWSRALRQAHWLAAASARRSGKASGIEEFWDAEASKLIAPHLHAAALAGEPVTQVLTWLESDDRALPIEILKSDGDPAAQSQLEGVLALDPRNTGTTYMSAAHVLAAYRHPEVAATARPGFTAEDLLDGSAGTLYISARASHQKMLAPIFVALITSVIEAAIEKSRREQQRLDPLLRVILEEAANIAPLDDLPGYLSQTADDGLRIATVWQSISQLRDRYGEAKDTILGSSTDKLFLGPITDQETRAEIDHLLGQTAVPVDDHSTLASKASAQELQQIPAWRGILVSGALPPALIRVDPYWRVRMLRKLLKLR